MGTMVPDPIVGTTLGKDYGVVEEIGRGGMAVVYLVEHQTLLKHFAAKVLSVELAANLEARARFTQEAHAASQLDHENIVTISDFGVTADHRPYFVMELLRGKTLGQRIAEGPMSVEEIVAVAIPIGRALAHAHAEGVVHRDVKPENIFLVQRSQGRFGVKVVDFGIAKAPTHDAKLTKMGQTLGSPMFMAPEACRGDDVDHRADVYSLGILLYLMFCGRVPFEDPSLLKVLQMQVTSPLPPPRSIKPSISPEIAAVISHALEKHPDDRYSSMLDLLDAFEASLPAGADRLLVEAQRGSTQAIRTTPFPGVTLTPRLRTSAGPSNPQLTVAATMRPAAPGPNRKLWVVVLLSIAFAVLGVVFAIQHSGGSRAEPEREPPQAGSNAPIAQAPLPPRKVVPDPTDGSPAPPVVGPAQVQVRITSIPSGGTVVLAGKKLGVTPFESSMDRADRSVEVVISRRGYADAVRTVDLRDAVALDVALVSTPKPAKPTRTDTKKPVPTEPKPTPKGDPALDIRLTR